MNYITLYNIGELNREDTPVFDTIEHQQAFFSEAERQVVTNNSFYVPKFKDEICLSSDDVDFNSAHTYLSIYFNDKYYYYFIDKVEYVSEDVVKLHISMDVIQTYMFNIKFHNSEITRKSIKRWNGVQINRDYIRENVSNSIFKNSINEVFSQLGMAAYVIHIIPTNQQYWYSREAEEPYLPIMETFKGSEKTVVDYNSRKYVEAGFFLILPFRTDKLVGSKYAGDTGTFQLGITAWDMFRYMCERDYVLSIDIIGGAYLAKLGITYDSSSDTFTCHEAPYTSRFIQIYNGSIPGADVHHPSPECAGFMLLYGANTQFLKNIEHTIDRTPVPFVKNTAKNALFSKNYCPQLMDENYVQVRYGEPSFLTGFPISVSTDTSIVLRRNHDLVNNIRVYSLSLSPTTDRYLTTIYATSVQTITLYNNAFQNYTSRNQSTLNAGRALAHFNNIYKAVGEGIKEGSVLSGVESGLVGAINYEAERAINLENLKFTPDTTKVNGNGAFDIISENIGSRFIVDVVTNINECAEYFETYGYKVHEISTENLFNINNRYYYDYIKVDKMSISLTILSDETTLGMIRERFRNGLRLWHTTDGTLNTATVEGVDLSMGQVCKYDNVEN